MFVEANLETSLFLLNETYLIKYKFDRERNSSQIENFLEKVIPKALLPT